MMPNWRAKLNSNSSWPWKISKSAVILDSLHLISMKTLTCQMLINIKIPRKPKTIERKNQSQKPNKNLQLKTDTSIQRSQFNLQTNNRLQFMNLMSIKRLRRLIHKHHLCQRSVSGLLRFRLLTMSFETSSDKSL